MGGASDDGDDGRKRKWQLAWGRWNKWEAMGAMPGPEFREWQGLRQVTGRPATSAVGPAMLQPIAAARPPSPTRPANRAARRAISRKNAPTQRMPPMWRKRAQRMGVQPKEDAASRRCTSKLVRAMRTRKFGRNGLDMRPVWMQREGRRRHRYALPKVQGPKTEGRCKRGRNKNR